MKKLAFLAPFLTCVVLVLLTGRAGAQFDTPNRAFHNTTPFRLEGKHLTVACESCHVNGQYAGTPRTCYDCHWIRKRDDRYQLRLGVQCEQCHRPTSWIDTRWDHASQTGTVLNADHRALACESCHRNASFSAVASGCVDCHQRDFAATTTPNHAAAGFSTACESCHRPSDNTWRNNGGGGFDHAASYPLLGTHATTTCASCHKNNVYRGTGRECVSCHLAQYTATRTPSHAAAGFPTTCEACHRASDPAWTGASFSHASVFALVGRHATTSCASCHVNNVYRGTARDCVGCHREQYNATRAPNHASAGFPTTCEGCHRASDPAWAGASFSHASVFALVGRHATTSCASCHVNNVFRGTARDCVGCHRDEYNATRTPNHGAAGFPTTCDACHRASDPAWTGASFNHGSVFALVGRHASTSCASCHVNNVYRGTSRTCVGCHQAQYNATRNPNHASSGFGTNCDSCHRASDGSWEDGTFNHRFPLRSNHNVACSRCHTTSNYSSFTCTGCHTRSETDSEHRGRSGYVYDSRACYSCHPNGR
ncbi:MAG: hypothetical protein AB7H96_19915 [Vicinamibacterales bacterium]